MPRRISIALLFTFSLLAIGQLSSIAAKPGDPAAHKQETGNVLPPSRTAWMTASWTGDDAPYKAMRDKIDALAKSGKLTAALIAKYKSEAEPKYNDPQAVFRWAYACYKAQPIHPMVHPPYVVNGNDFDVAAFPNAYNYARLEFLASAPYSPSPKLADAGKRLLKRDPNDYDVEYGLVHSFRPWASQAAKREVLFYANDLLHKYPNKPSAHAATGWVYFSTWMVKRDKADGEKAISAYKDYLRLAPLSYDFRPQAQKIIKYIEQRLSAG